ncbi:MAG: hypothetical protein LQ350_007512 [Teloschistes chrysophthalmus]|nr:MAG: hypothetical protein LQ350_007512 [Niorma chrysophthalma]
MDVEPQRPFELPALKSLWPTSDSEKCPPPELPTTFPIQRLPTEIRLHIIRVAMPQCGLRPTPRPEEDFSPSDSACQAYAASVLQEDTTPLRLLTLNKAIFAEAAEIFYKGTTLHIDITAQQVRFLNTTLEMRRFPSHQTLTELSLFTRMQHYHLDIRFMKISKNTSHYIPNVTTTIKESIRLIADALSQNPNIKTHTVAVPYYCVPTLYYGGA